MIHLMGAIVPVPYPSWLNPADNTWQITAATFVGLMSLPGLAVLYASIVPKKWAVNVMAMMFAGFSLVLDRLGARGPTRWASAPRPSAAG